MDQKHAMLYPDPNAMPADQRSSAAAAMGLPIEPPPTYDVATKDASSSSATFGWANNTTDINYPSSSHYNSSIHQNHLPVIVEQANFPLPTNQPPQSAHTQQQQTDGIPVTTQPTTNLTSKLGPNPSNITCPDCGVSKTSRICYTPNTKTHLSALALCIVGWCFCACIVPYCMNSCRTGNHYCSNCNAFLGAYNADSHSYRPSRHGRRGRRNRR